MATPNINAILRANPRSARYGAPLGASNNVGDGTGRLYCQRIRFVDGDYAADGTYWGGGSALWCIFSPEDHTRIYVRAKTRVEAIAAAREDYPDIEGRRI